MKVAWVHNFPPDVPSAGVFMHVLAEEMTRQGCEPLLVYTGSLRRPDRILRAVGRLGKVVRGCDAVHAQYGSGCGHVVSKLPGPKVLTLRGSDWYGLPPTSIGNRLRRIATRWLTRRSLPRYDAVLAVSERMKRSLEAELNGPPAIEVLPGGIDLTCFEPMDRAEARRRLGEADDTSPWILFCVWEWGSPLKRPWLAEAAFEQLEKQMPNARLITLTGKAHDEIPLWLNACDVVLLTSTHEGWPNIIKEALACNVPFVSTDVSDLRAIAAVEPNCCVADAVPEDLAHGLASALHHGRTTTLRRHAEAMDVKENARRLIQLYDRVVNLKDQPGDR